MSDFDLNGLIRDALASWKEPDPHVIARRLLARIPDEHVRDALAACLHDRVRLEVTRQRMSEPPREAGTAGQIRSKGKSRWQNFAPILMRRYCIAGEWKLLGECTAADCDLAADDYAKRAAEQAAIEARFRALAEQIRREGVERVADLAAVPQELAA